MSSPSDGSSHKSSSRVATPAPFEHDAPSIVGQLQEQSHSQEYVTIIDDHQVKDELMQDSLFTPPHSPSPDPLHLSTPVHLSTPEQVDNLLEFSPTGTPAQSRYNSPEPIILPSTMISPVHSPSPPPPPSPSPPLQTVVEDRVTPDIPPENDGRYSFRQRGLKQLRPFQYENAEYQKTLKHHPEAIVKMRGHRHETRDKEDDYEQEEESQEQDPYQHRHNHRRTPSPEQPNRRRTGLSAELSSSGDDERSKDARKIKKGIIREEREKLKEKRRQEAAQKQLANRRFPLSKPGESSRSRSRRHSEVIVIIAL